MSSSNNNYMYLGAGIKSFVNNYGDIIFEGFAKNLYWIAPVTLGIAGAVYGISTYADHDAMEHGYERQVKIGSFEKSIKCLSSDEASSKRRLG